MNTRYTNMLLWLAAGLLASGSAVTLGVGLLLPLQSAGRRPVVGSAVVRSATASTGANLPPLEAFENVWSRQLRAPAEQAAKATPSPAPLPKDSIASPGAGLSMTLVGTIGTSLALIRLSDGSTVLKAVGEEVGGGHIVSIGPALVEVQSNGQNIRLVKPTSQTPMILPTP